MDAEDVLESIVHQSTDVSTDVVQIEPGTGRYECKVTNALGTTTKFIVLHPQGKSNIDGHSKVDDLTQYLNQ